MRERLVMTAIAAAIVCVGGSACAMTSTENLTSGCRVINGDKLSPQSGGADALCKAIAEAAAETAPGVTYSVEISVLPKDRLSALVTLADGRKLPELGIASMDKPLTAGSFKRFANSIAQELAKAGAARP